jgi:hypothetical protein
MRRTPSPSELWPHHKSGPVYSCHHMFRRLKLDECFGDCLLRLVFKAQTISPFSLLSRSCEGSSNPCWARYPGSYRASAHCFHLPQPQMPVFHVSVSCQRPPGVSETPTWLLAMPSRHRQGPQQLFCLISRSQIPGFLL